MLCVNTPGISSKPHRTSCSSFQKYTSCVTKGRRQRERAISESPAEWSPDQLDRFHFHFRCWLWMFPSALMFCFSTALFIQPHKPLCGSLGNALQTRRRTNKPSNSWAFFCSSADKRWVKTNPSISSPNLSPLRGHGRAGAYPELTGLLHDHKNPISVTRQIRERVLTHLHELKKCNNWETLIYMFISIVVFLSECERCGDVW